MKKRILVQIFLFSFITFSCQNDKKKFDGSSKENFQKSRELIEQGKNQYQIKLIDEAIDIIDTNSYSTNFGNISNQKMFKRNYEPLERINGLTYDETIKLAEKILEEEKNIAIVDLQKQIEFVEVKKFNDTNNQKKINSAFKITDFKLVRSNEGEPILDVEFTYTGNEKLTKYIDISLVIRENKSRESISEDYQFLLDEAPLINGGKLNASISLKKYEKIISSIKLPFVNPNLEKYGLNFEYYFETIFINDDLYLGRGYGSQVAEVYIEETKNKLEEIKKMKTKLE